jgi:hypothetical protein
MTSSSSSWTRSTSRRAAGSYGLPTPLEDLHILDLLELAGSQYKAGAALAVHQSTVSRSLRLMQQQFRLVSGEGSATCRYGHNTCLQYLRLAYREHRLMEGLLRIGTDPLHQGFLDGMAILQQVPAQFRSSEHWAELVRLGLLDGAIVSSFSLVRSFPGDGRPTWDGLAVLPLGQLGLQLVATAPETQGVLLPRKLATPLLHQTLLRQGWEVMQQPIACQEPAAWLKRARDRQLAIPICSELVGTSWLAANNLEALTDQPQLDEQLWLLLPEPAVNTRAARLALCFLRQQVAKTAGMQKSHQIQS